VEKNIVGRCRSTGLLVIQLIDGDRHVSRPDRTRIHVSVIFGNEIDIMKDKTLEVVFIRREDERGIHQNAFVVRSVAQLFGDEDFVIEFLSLKNRMEIREKSYQMLESISVRNDDGDLNRTNSRRGEKRRSRDSYAMPSETMRRRPLTS
jgi:hypothetical protein